MKKNKSTPARKSNQSSAKVQVDKDSRVSVRQIENGFIVSESGTMGNGRNARYYEKEYFSRTNPVAGVGGKITFGKK